ncbi:MAG TPA: hypothetical protein VFV82_09710 [Candidatus Binatia bacterium]|nr:hypothetical protein [Candidatus Binatia bacterium]
MKRSWKVRFLNDCDATNAAALLACNAFYDYPMRSTIVKLYGARALALRAPS